MSRNFAFEKKKVKNKQMRNSLLWVISRHIYLHFVWGVCERESKR